MCVCVIRRERWGKDEKERVKEGEQRGTSLHFFSLSFVILSFSIVFSLRTLYNRTYVIFSRNP